LIRVDFPDPFWPTSAWTLRGLTVSLASSSATCPRKVLLNEAIAMTASADLAEAEAMMRYRSDHPRGAQLTPQSL
jgi:hypothetical protein